MAFDNDILDFAVVTVVNGNKFINQLGLVTITDARLTDARTPLPHTHSLSDVIGLTSALNLKEDKANKEVASGYAGLDGSGLLTGSRVPYGTIANTACQGNDPRLSDGRTPIGPASGDLSGAYPSPLVTGWQGLALPTTSARQYVRKNGNATSWEAADEAPTLLDFTQLSDDYYRLFNWVVSTFGTVPDGMEDTFERAQATT